MLRVGFEPRIPVSKRVKTVHALDCAATVIGAFCSIHTNLCGTKIEEMPYLPTPNIQN
jgi:hypothetical protein